MICDVDMEIKWHSRLHLWHGLHLATKIAKNGPRASKSIQKHPDQLCWSPISDDSHIPLSSIHLLLVTCCYISQETYFCERTLASLQNPILKGTSLRIRIQVNCGGMSSVKTLSTNSRTKTTWVLDLMHLPTLTFPADCKTSQFSWSPEIRANFAYVLDRWPTCYIEIPQSSSESIFIDRSFSQTRPWHTQCLLTGGNGSCQQGQTHWD